MIAPALEAAGLQAAGLATLEALSEPGERFGRVGVVHRINCEVLTANGTEIASPSPRLAERPGSATLPAVGDWVVLSDDEDTDEAVIMAIAPRWSAISRRDPADKAAQQVLATNIDEVWVVHGMDRDQNLRRFERALALAYDSGAQPVVILTKADLVDDPEAWAEPVREVAHDVDVCLTSSTTGRGIVELRTRLAGHQTVALLGASGAGKSTLLNLLADDSLVATGAVRDSDAKGRHTTVQRQLIVLPAGGVVVDTPGLRGLGLWDAELGVDLAFPDVIEAAEHCQFRDCSHTHEPDCGVKSAIEAGVLAPRRLESYRRLVDELQDLDRRQVEQERANRNRQSPARSPGRVQRRGKR